MEDRILKLLDMEQLSSSRFADVIGVQRSSVSHILSGRNKPSFDFLQKTLKAFPYLNADWLILGEGKMYAGEEISSGGNLFEQKVEQVKKDTDTLKTVTENENIEQNTSPSELIISEENIDRPGSGDSEALEEGIPVHENNESEDRTLKKVILLYTDNTFETYDPIG